MFPDSKVHLIWHQLHINVPLIWPGMANWRELQGLATVISVSFVSSFFRSHRIALAPLRTLVVPSSNLLPRNRQNWTYLPLPGLQVQWAAKKTTHTYWRMITLACYFINRPFSQIPECTCSISHNAPFRTEMCTFLFWKEPCGIWNRCIQGFVS